MPILKPISGHGSVGGIKRYLEKKNRALAKDLFNLSWDERGNCNDPQENKEFVLWDVEMDVTRASAGHNEPWKGKQARTFKHFVISPDPQDRIDLEALRELASSWVLKHFPDNQIAIIYHDDNEGSIPHAHIVVNSTDLRTGRRMHTDHPEDLNRDLQDMAREMGLTGLSNEMPKRGEKKPEASTPRSRRHPRRSQHINRHPPRAAKSSAGRGAFGRENTGTRKRQHRVAPDATNMGFTFDRIFM